MKKPQLTIYSDIKLKGTRQATSFATSSIGSFSQVSCTNIFFKGIQTGKEEVKLPLHK